MVILGERCWGYNGVVGVKMVLSGERGVKGCWGHNGVFGVNKGCLRA